MCTVMVLLVLLASLINNVQCNSFVIPSYTETGECEGEQVCSYSYSAHQEQFGENGELQTFEVTATVDTTCLSRGVYNESDAKLYCMTIRNANVMSNVFENSTDEEMSHIQKLMNDQLMNWFCFVQASCGKISAVYHASSEPDDIISLKKTIAAGFQANFLETEEEEETDPQSRHVSHYSYTPTREEGLLKMKRTIRKEDVKEYADEGAGDDVDTTKEEEIVYRSGKLEKSSGTATFRLVNRSNIDDSTDDEDSTFSFDQVFFAHGSYEIKVQTCHRVNQYMMGLRKKHIFKKMERDLKEEGLKATVNKREEAIEEMKALREKLQYGSVLSALQNYNDYGDKLFQILLVLVELESEYGAVSPYIPALDDILTYMAMMPADSDIRDDIVMLLCTEGSSKSQMAVLRAYDNALDATEKNKILVHISFMKNVDISFVLGVKERLLHKQHDKMLSDQLLLVFASLATKGPSQVEDCVMSYLSDQVTTLLSKMERASSNISLLLYALGNTGSKHSVPLVFSIYNASMEYVNHHKVKLVVIESLSKLTDDTEVLAKLEKFVQEDDSSEECIATVIECLDTGLDYVKKNSKETLQDYLATIKSHGIMYSLVSAVVSSNDTDLYRLMGHYLSKINVDETLLNAVKSHSAVNRGKRGTTDWASSTESDYNYVQGLSTRQIDALTYDLHQSYLNSERVVGGSTANIKVAYGYFAGTNSRCLMMKLYGRMKVVGNFLSWSKTFADVKMDVQLDEMSYSVVLYAKIGDNTLLDLDNRSSVPSNPCQTYTRPLTENRILLFPLSFSIFVYVARITLRVDVYGHFDMGTNLNFCSGRSSTEVSGALGSLTPTVGVSITGSVRASLLSLARGGVDVTVRFNYRLEPAASVQACPASCSLTGRMCIGIYDSHAGSNININGWYQLRKIGFCGSWIRLPCIKWGRRREWYDETWSIGRQDRRAIWQRCRGNLHQSCAATALSSPLFVGE